MKKKKTVILCAVIAFLIAAGAVTWAFLPHALNYPIDSIQPVGSGLTVLARADDSVKLCKKGEGEVKILMFTDMHLDGKNKTSNTTVKYLVENIQKEKPDLVILGGDNVTSAFNRKRAKQLCEIFEKLDVYWAGVLGNHEGDNAFSVSREDMMGIFCSYEHCLMRKGIDDVDGVCNYTLEITDKSGQKNLKTFFFLDTFDMVEGDRKTESGFSKDEKVTDGVHTNQVEWYQSKVARLKETYGDFQSIVVMHIPLPQMETAAEADNAEFLYGAKNEGVCSSNIDTGMFAAIKEAGVTEAVFFGHDHKNNFGLEYEGVMMSYIEASGYGSYHMGTGDNKVGEEQWLQGCTRLVLHEKGGFTLTELKNNADLTGEAPVSYER